MKKTLTVGSLFSGVGGIDLGFQEAENANVKYELVWANELDSYASETYKFNFSHDLLEGDINYVLHPGKSDDFKKYKLLHDKILSQPIDILNGGFPCQPFSIAGDKKGFNDERGNLFMSFIDLINQLNDKFNKKPKIVFLENVKNLKTMDNGNTYKVIKNKLEENGYTVKEAVLNTMYYSKLPQNRERIYIIAFLNKDDANRFTMFENLQEFKIKKTIHEKEAEIKNIINYDESDQRFFYNKEKYPNYFVSIEEYNSKLDKKNERINLTEIINEPYQFYQVRRGQYVRKNKNGVSPTLTANMGTGGHNIPLIYTDKGIRKLTPTEVFKLQGFPINKNYQLPTMYKGKPYGYSHLYKQAGNAVSVPVITLIATELLKIFE